MNTKSNITPCTSVHGFENEISQICALLKVLGYNVWNSHLGTIRVNPALSNLENCLKAVEDCDSFPQLQVQNYYANKNDFESLLDESFESLNINVKRKMLAILTLLDKNPGLRTTAINDKTGIPTKSIERYLSDLKQCGLIVYKGSSSSGGYYIVHDKE